MKPECLDLITKQHGCLKAGVDSHSKNENGSERAKAVLFSNYFKDCFTVRIMYYNSQSVS